MSTVLNPVVPPAVLGRADQEQPVTGGPPPTVMRVAIVGCGAVTEKKHLPALSESERLRVVALVDLDEPRARRLADQYAIPEVYGHTAALSGRADIGLVAVPHHLHPTVAIDLMRAGLHPFVEKPLATNMRDVGAMLAAGAASGRRIGVGLLRRQYAAFRFAQQVLEAGWLGRIETFDFREGGPYNWPVATIATFKRETAGGVLFDTGAHTLDMLTAWLGPFAEVSYSDDCEGGVEANCLLHLTLESGVRGVVELSRTRALRNTCIIRGARGEMEIGVGPAGPVTLRVDGAELCGPPRIHGIDDPAPLDLVRRQLEDFAGALQSGFECELFAEHTLEPIRIYDACRENPQRLDLPWEAWDEANAPAISGTILVLGGTGFIGGRLVDVLARQPGVRVRVLSRSLARLSAVCRHDLEVVVGDVGEPATLARALRGCDVVVNCTFGRGPRDVARQINVEAVQNIIRLAAENGVPRVVHLSTVSAYGIPPDGELREDDPHTPPRSFVYGYTKWQGEQAGLAEAAKSGVDLRILQPTVVYGPGAPSWTVNPLRMLKSGRVVLIDGGLGLCNPVFVDDVVQAIIRAATAGRGRGERFLISGPETITWRDFYAAYEEMLGISSTVPMTLDEVNRRRAEQRKQLGTRAQLAAILRDPAVFRRLTRLPVIDKAKALSPRRAVDIGKAVLLGRVPATPRSAGPTLTPEKPLHVPAELDALFQAGKTRVRIDKAERILGYKPAFDFTRGIGRTRGWATWANLL